MESSLQLSGILASIHMAITGYVSNSIRGIISPLREMKHGKRAI